MLGLQKEMSAECPIEMENGEMVCNFCLCNYTIEKVKHWKFLSFQKSLV